jgi:hypothetical protein
VLFL